MEPIETNTNIGLNHEAKRLKEKIDILSAQIARLENVISYLEMTTKRPDLNRESRETTTTILEEKRAELALLELEYNEKSDKYIEFIDDKSDDEQVKLIRKEVEELYNGIMKVKYYVPGYLYSNEEEYKRLEYAMDAYNIIALDLILKMSIIEDDLKAINAEVINPTMTKEEKELYFELSKIIWTMAIEKERDAKYIYTNVTQADSLVAEFERLKTKNPYITEMVHIITKDIKIFKEKTEGKASADEYQKKLKDLKIKSPLDGAPDPGTLGDKVEDITKPGKKGIKSKRKAGEAEKTAASASKKIAKLNGVKLVDYVAPVLFSCAGGLFSAVGIPYLIIRIIKDIKDGNWANTFTNIKNSFLNIGPSIANKLSEMQEKHDIRKEKREAIKAERKIRSENIRAIKRGISGDLNTEEDIEEEPISEHEAEAEHSRGGR